MNRLQEFVDQGYTKHISAIGRRVALALLELVVALLIGAAIATLIHYDQSYLEIWIDGIQWIGYFGSYWLAPLILIEYMRRKSGLSYGGNI